MAITVTVPSYSTTTKVNLQSTESTITAITGSSYSTITKVDLPSTESRITAITGTSKVQTAVRLDGLLDVEVEGAQDGYTFTYNADTAKWIASPASGLTANIDGGTY